MAVTPSAGRVVVTGASRGIGRAVVDALLDNGATVAVVARGRDALAEIAAAHEGRVLVCAADVSDAEQRQRLVARVSTELGRVDALVQCAGMIVRSPVGSIRQIDVESMLAVNFTGPLLLAQSVAGLMRAQGGGGSIVNVASTLGLVPAAGALAYSASKAALVSATRTLALELAGAGIRVNAVAPGIVDTDMAKGRAADELARMHPLGRLGRPEEVATAIVELLDAEWTTGTTYVVDGGMLAGSPA